MRNLLLFELELWHDQLLLESNNSLFSRTNGFSHTHSQLYNKVTVQRKLIAIILQFYLRVHWLSRKSDLVLFETCDHKESPFMNQISSYLCRQRFVTLTHNIYDFYASRWIFIELKALFHAARVHLLLSASCSLDCFAIRTSWDVCWLMESWLHIYKFRMCV